MPETMPDPFNGDKLRRDRNARGWSQSELGRAVGTTGNYISKIERGTLPGKGLRKRIAEVLEKGLPMDNQRKTDEQEILAAYRKLSGINKARAHAYITALTHSQSPALNRP